jgi:hypothetical protein
VVDDQGKVHSLARQIEGVRTQELKAFFAPLLPEHLPGVDQVRQAAARSSPPDQAGPDSGYHEDSSANVR